MSFRPHISSVGYNVADSLRTNKELFKELNWDDIKLAFADGVSLILELSVKKRWLKLSFFYCL